MQWQSVSLSHGVLGVICGTSNHKNASINQKTMSGIEPVTKLKWTVAFSKFFHVTVVVLHNSTMSCNENTALHVIYVRCMCVVRNKTLYYIHSTQSYVHMSDVFNNRALVDASEETLVQCLTQGRFIVQTGRVREGTSDLWLRKVKGRTRSHQKVQKSKYSQADRG